MTKQSTITTLLAIPLIASAIFLASPAFASGPLPTAHAEVRNVTSEESAPTETSSKKSIYGAVTSVSGTIIVVASKENTEYTVDASHATVMKESEESNGNPSIVPMSNIKVGDMIMARGIIRNTD